VNAVQWGIGLELALLIEDPWRVYLTTDHPNGGDFTKYPRIISWLMSTKARERAMRKLNGTAKRKLDLQALDREYSFSEIATITRAGTARALNLHQKGHLGIGADADISIYNINPKEVNPSREYRTVRRALKAAAFTIKDGRIVVKNGEVTETPQGRTYWVDSEVPQPLASEVESKLRRNFREYYTVEMDNYQMDDDELENSHKITVKARL